MPYGSTSEETENRLRLKHQTVSPRYTELRQWGYIAYLRDDAGHRKQRDTNSGRGAYVHEPTSKGWRAIAAGLPISKPGSADPTRGRSRGHPLSAAAFNSLKAANPKLRLQILIDISSTVRRQKV